MLATYEILIRLGLAIIIGFVVGLERERNHRPAGIKTHILVCMGATVISLIQIEMVADVIAKVASNPDLADVLKTDYGRLGAQVISGIGFLGAGTIMRTRGSIKGLTTAATLWLVACVGLGIGMGYYKISIIAIALVMIILTILKYFQEKIEHRGKLKNLDIVFKNKKETMAFIFDYFITRNISVKNIEFVEESDEFALNSKVVFRCNYSIVLPASLDFQSVINELCMEDNIIKINEGFE